MHVKTVKLREIRPLVDIVHTLLRALRDIRKFVVLGQAPSGTYEYDISPARLRGYKYVFSNSAHSQLCPALTHTENRADFATL